MTTPGGHIYRNFPPVSAPVLPCSNSLKLKSPQWKGIRSLAKLAFTPDPAAQAPAILGMLFTSNWLDSMAEHDEKSRTNRQIQGEVRYVSQISPCLFFCEVIFCFSKKKQELLIRVTFAKPQRFLGRISQMAAALTHHVSPSRLEFIGARIPKIIIVTGDEDCIVAPKESRRLWRGMTSNDRDTDGKGGQQDLRVELAQWEDAGHGIHLQKERKFNELVMRCVKEGRNLDPDSGS